MSKKIIVACMAIAAFAVMPAISSAVQLTHPTGTRLAVGTILKATNVGITKFVASGLTVECSNDVLIVKLTKNNGTEVEGTIETASFKGTESEGRCASTLGALKVTTTIGNGVPWCVKADAGAEMKLTVRGNSCDKAARGITFGFDVAGLECKYERSTATGPIVGTYTTDSEGSDAVVHIGAAGSAVSGTGEGNSFLCPASGTLEMSFTFETDTAAGEPVYFS